MAAKPDDRVVVAQPAWLRVALWVGLPPLGAALGWGLQAIASWVAGLPVAPFQGPFKLVASLPQPQVAVGALAVGGLAGLVFAFLVHLDSLTVTVTSEYVRLVRGDVRQEFERSVVTAVFVDEETLVLLGIGGRELVREKCGLSTDRLAAAFRTHGLDLRDTDPYDDAYRRWVEDTPDLPAAANALFKARARALDKGDSDDAAQLRTELARLDIVVRDDRKKRQFWRRTTASSGPPDPT